MHAPVNWNIVGSDNELSPVQCKAIWTNAGFLFIRNKLKWHFKRNPSFLIQEHVFLEISAIWQPFCLSLDMLNVVD